MSFPKDEVSTTSLILESEKREPSGKCQRSEWFAIMLYPDKNETHKRIMDFILSERGIFRSYVWILHERDVYIENTENHKKGDLKDPHIHMLFRLNKQSTYNGVIGLFDGDISHCEVIDNSLATVIYFLHRTYKAIKQGKPLYDETCLHGDPQVINRALAQNGNFVQLSELVSLLSSTPHRSLGELVSSISALDDCKAEEMYSVLKSWQSFISTLSNQEIKYKEFLR